MNKKNRIKLAKELVRTAKRSDYTLSSKKGEQTFMLSARSSGMW